MWKPNWFEGKEYDLASSIFIHSVILLLIQSKTTFRVEISFFYYPYPSFNKNDRLCKQTFVDGEKETLVAIVHLRILYPHPL